MRCTYFYFILIAGCLGTCFASEEVPLPLGSADIRGLDKIAGKVRLQIKSPEGGIESVTISAFGREIDIPEAEFEKLRGALYSEVEASHEAGHEQSGGYTVYFVLRFRDMFGGDPFEGDPMLEQRIRITVPEKGEVTVSKERVRLDQ